jgi:hypothetical protein
MATYVNGLIATGDYPELARLSESYELDEAWDIIAEFFQDPDRFDRNLARVLDGIEAALDNATKR